MQPKNIAKKKRRLPAEQRQPPPSASRAALARLRCQGQRQLTECASLLSASITAIGAESSHELERIFLALRFRCRPFQCQQRLQQMRRLVHRLLRTAYPSLTALLAECCSAAAGSGAIGRITAAQLTSIQRRVGVNFQQTTRALLQCERAGFAATRMLADRLVALQAGALATLAVSASLRSKLIAFANALVTVWSRIRDLNCGIARLEDECQQETKRGDALLPNDLLTYVGDQSANVFRASISGEERSSTWEILNRYFGDAFPDGEMLGKQA